jgi:hypothetical protein
MNVYFYVLDTLVKKQFLETILSITVSIDIQDTSVFKSNGQLQ